MFSSNIFTLNTFYTATKRIIATYEGSFQEKYSFVLNFWKNVVGNMREWNEMDNGELSKKDLRENYIVTQGVTILALGRLGKFYSEHPEISIEQSLTGLRSIDWLRNNTTYWLGRAIKSNGTINRSEHGIYLTYIQIKRHLGLPITDEEKKKETF